MRTTHILVVLCALTVSCASYLRGTDGLSRVSARASPRGTSQVILIDAQATLISAQAHCMANPSECGWIMPAYFPTSFEAGEMNTNAYYLDRTSTEQRANTAGASVVLNQELVLENEELRRDNNFLLNNSDE